MSRTRLRLLLASLATGLVTAALPAAAQASYTGTCRPEGGPRCTFWVGKLSHVSDGDTIRVIVNGTELNIRVTGIQAMEQSVYSSYPDRRRGDCHALEATARMEAIMRLGDGRVRLAAQDPASRTGTRWRRSIAVYYNGAWHDVGRMLVTEGHALWLPNAVENAWDPTYSTLAQQAAAAHRRLYLRNYCGLGPGTFDQVSMGLNPDAAGNDGENVNGEYADIYNHGTTALSLARWYFRDSALRRYTFPSGATIPPGGRVRLRMGYGTATSSTFYWGLSSPPFENSGDGGYLFDPQGDLRAWVIYPCRFAC